MKNEKTVTKLTRKMTFILLPLLYFISIQVPAVLSEKETLDGLDQKTFMVAVPANREPTTPITITTRVALDTRLKDPSVPNLVYFSVSYQGHLNRWAVELEPGVREGYSEKTLCVREELRNGTERDLSVTENPVAENIFIVAYSRTMNKLKLEIASEKNERFIVQKDQALQVNVDQFTSQVYQYNFGTEDKSVLLTIESQTNGGAMSHGSEDICMYVALNRVGCPWHDSVQTIQNSKVWSRILKLGYFTLESKDYPGGFQVTLITLASNEQCISHNHLHPVMETVESKRVTLNIQSLDLDYALPVAVSVTVVVVLALLFSGCWLAAFKLLDSCLLEGGEEDGRQKSREAEAEETQYDNPLIAALVEALDNREFGPDEAAVEAAVMRLKAQEDRDLSLRDMTVMIRKCIWHRRVRSYGYLLVVPLLSVFYLIPSVQLVYAEWARSDDAGNIDRCWHNHGCARPFGILPDFNHTVSNVGYIIYGLFFIAIVFLKSRILPDDNQPSVDHENDTGLVQQYSIFYTLGICMILQGVFSSTFHICPSNVSLQFDTSMMYMMMVLSFIKTFQFRHPDTSANVFTAMYTFCVLIFLESVSLYITSPTTKIAFHAVCGLLYLGLIIYLSVENYFYGAIKVSYRITIPILWEHMCDKSRHPYRLFVMVLFFLFNAAMVLFLFVKVVNSKREVDGLSTPILLLCAANTALYLTQYLFKKIFEIVRDSDSYTGAGCCLRLCLLFLFLILFLGFGFIAGYFYSQKLQSRNLSPAESRNMNAPCEPNFGGFYDNHDLWHFFSATALFLAFLFLLTIDDDLMNTKRKEIKIF